MADEKLPRCDDQRIFLRRKRMSIGTGRPVECLSRPDVLAVAAMSRCAQRTSSAKTERKAAALEAPPSRTVA